MTAQTLTIFGMGFVFLFLALMVAVTNMMSLIVDKIQPTVNVPPLIQILQMKLMTKQERLLKQQ